MNDLRPNKSELLVLNLAYNKFFDIFEELMLDNFWDKNPKYRFNKIKQGFLVYSELLYYEPIQWVLKEIKKSRPPEEGEIADELFRFIRNVLAHFPFFDTWDEVWISFLVINWNKDGQFIDKFLLKNKAREPIKYRFWEGDKKLMTYLSINFPKEYKENSKIFLKDMVSEKEGVKFSYILMKKVLDSQVVN